MQQSVPEKGNHGQRQQRHEYVCVRPMRRGGVKRLCHGARVRGGYDHFDYNIAGDCFPSSVVYPGPPAQRVPPHLLQLLSRFLMIEVLSVRSSF